VKDSCGYCTKIMPVLHDINNKVKLIGNNDNPYRQNYKPFLGILLLTIVSVYVSLPN